MKKTIYKALFFLLTSMSLSAQDLTVFKLDNLYGYKLGDSIMIKPQYQFGRDFLFDSGIVYKNKNAGVIDYQNNVLIPFEYQGIYTLNDSLFLVKVQSKYFAVFKWGVIDKNNELILPIIYSNIFLKHGNLFVDLRKDSIVGKGIVGDIRSITRTFGIYSLDGNPVLDPIYNIRDMITDSIYKMGLDQHYGLISTNGDFITEMKYTALSDFHNEKSKVRVDSSYGFINLEGVEIIRPQYRGVSSFYRDLAVYRKHNGKVGFIDSTGNEIYESNYTILKYPNLGCAAAKKGGKWGLISTSGKQLIKFKHNDYIREFDGVIAFKKKKKWALFDSQGKKLTRYKYDSIFVFGSRETSKSSYWKLKESRFMQPIAYVTKDDQHGIINSKGELIIPLNSSKTEVFNALEEIVIR